MQGNADMGWAPGMPMAALFVLAHAALAACHSLDARFPVVRQPHGAIQAGPGAYSGRLSAFWKTDRALWRRCRHPP